MNNDLLMALQTELICRMLSFALSLMSVCWLVSLLFESEYQLGKKFMRAALVSLTIFLILVGALGVKGEITHLIIILPLTLIVSGFAVNHILRLFIYVIERK